MTTGRNDWHFKSIGVVESPFPEKFGIPRQSGLLDIPCRIWLEPWVAGGQALQGIDDFSHLWLLFVFHQSLQGPYRPMVRPPRLGGNQRRGVFATRAPYRPNPIGLSCVQLLARGNEQGRFWLEVAGADLMSGTPILDIKPYLPYADCREDARAAFAEEAPGKVLAVDWSHSAESALQTLQSRYPSLKDVLEQSLRLDPRPAYHDDVRREYFLRLYDVEASFTVSNGTACVNWIRQASCADDARHSD